MLFQLQDDILDYSATNSKFGKIVGGDIKEGKVTLPLLMLLEHCNNKDTVLKLFTSRDHTQLIALFQRENIINHCSNFMKAYIDKCINCLNKLPNSKYNQLLGELIDFIANRAY
jgi:geranylgeranyl pyrophosphate synthase